MNYSKCVRCQNDKKENSYKFCYDCITFFKENYKFKDCPSCKKSFRLLKDKDYPVCYPCLNEAKHRAYVKEHNIRE